MVGNVLGGLAVTTWAWCEHPFAQSTIVDVDVTMKWTATPFVDSPPVRNGVDNWLPVVVSSYVHMVVVVVFGFNKKNKRRSPTEVGRGGYC